MKDHHGMAPSIGAKGMQLGETNRESGEQFEFQLLNFALTLPTLCLCTLLHGSDWCNEGLHEDDHLTPEG